ncbi:hypothetical protein T484DRAFT_1827462, partial [Baffinella frigidus]
VPTEKLSGDALASAISAALADSSLTNRAKEVEKMLGNENGVHTSVDLISRFMQRPWDRTAMQILPRREGDLEMQEGTMFKSWSRYKFVLKDHCMEYHRYLPTGLHDPQIMGTFVMNETEVSEFIDVSGHQNYAFELRDSKGKRLAVLGGASAREQSAWITFIREVSKTWETPFGAGVTWSAGMANKLSNMEADETGGMMSKASKLQSIEEAASSGTGRGGGRK